MQDKAQKRHIKKTKSWVIEKIAPDYLQKPISF